VAKRVLEALARDLKERGKLDLSGCSIDSTFIMAKDEIGAPTAALRSHRA
jgi:hypothetical protein